MVSFFVVFRVDDGYDVDGDDEVRCSDGAETVIEMFTECVGWLLETRMERDEFVLEIRTAPNVLVAEAVKVGPAVDEDTPDGKSTLEDATTVFATVADEFQLPNPSDTTVSCAFKLFDVVIVGKVAEVLR